MVGATDVPQEVNEGDPVPGTAIRARAIIPGPLNAGQDRNSDIAAIFLSQPVPPNVRRLQVGFFPLQLGELALHYGFGFGGHLEKLVGFVTNPTATDYEHNLSRGPAFEAQSSRIESRVEGGDSGGPVTVCRGPEGCKIPFLVGTVVGAKESAPNVTVSASLSRENLNWVTQILLGKDVTISVTNNTGHQRIHASMTGSGVECAVDGVAGADGGTDTDSCVFGNRNNVTFRVTAFDDNNIAVTNTVTFNRDTVDPRMCFNVRDADHPRYASLVVQQQECGVPNPQPIGAAPGPTFSVHGENVSTEDQITWKVDGNSKDVDLLPCKVKTADIPFSTKFAAMDAICRVNDNYFYAGEYAEFRFKVLGDPSRTAVIKANQLSIQPHMCFKVRNRGALFGVQQQTCDLPQPQPIGSEFLF
jgi:hypothetical protein